MITLQRTRELIREIRDKPPIHQLLVRRHSHNQRLLVLQVRSKLLLQRLLVLQHRSRPLVQRHPVLHPLHPRSTLLVQRHLVLQLRSRLLVQRHPVQQLVVQHPPASRIYPQEALLLLVSHLRLILRTFSQFCRLEVRQLLPIPHRAHQRPQLQQLPLHLARHLTRLPRRCLLRPLLLNHRRLPAALCRLLNRR